MLDLTQYVINRVNVLSNEIAIKRDELTALQGQKLALLELLQTAQDAQKGEADEAGSPVAG